MKVLSRSITIILLACSLSGAAQFTSTIVEKELEYPFSGVSIAIDAKEPKRIILASDANRIYYSLDSGRNWTKRVIINSKGIISDPFLSSDRKGKFYLTGRLAPMGDQWDPEAASGMIGAFYSGNGGETWYMEGSFGSFDDPDIRQYHAQLNVRNGELSVAWVQGRGNGPPPNVYFSRSPGGKKWSSAISLVKDPPADVEGGYQYPVTAPGASGQVYAAWISGGQILVDRTYDGKMWLRNDLKIADAFENGVFSVPGYSGPAGKLGLVVDVSSGPFSGSIYAAWADQRANDGGSDVYMIRSNNRGDTWSSPGQINHSDEGKFQYAPALAVDPVNGLLYIAYLDRRDYDDDRADLYLSWSTDGGNNFSIIKVNDQPVNHSGIRTRSALLSVSAMQGLVCPAWVDKDEAGTLLRSVCISYEQLGIK